MDKLGHMYINLHAHKPAIQKIICVSVYIQTLVMCPVIISELSFGETKGLQSFVYKYN